METTATHRALIGGAGVAAIVAATLAAASAHQAPTPNISADPVWSKLVADFGVKYAAWLAALDIEEDADDMFRDACAALPPEPAKPGSAIIDNVLDKTVREIRDACDTPEHKQAWIDYKREHAAWTARRDTLHEQILAPAKAACDSAFAIRAAALNALTRYCVSNLRDLGEKMEIILKTYDGFDIPSEYVADILADVRHLAAKS